MISPSTIETIRRVTPIAKIIGETVVLRRVGRSMVGACIECRHVELSVNSEKGFFYCFHCKFKGNVFDWVMTRDNVSFQEAAKRLAEKCLDHVKVVW